MFWVVSFFWVAYVLGGVVLGVAYDLGCDILGCLLCFGGCNFWVWLMIWVVSFLGVGYVLCWVIFGWALCFCGDILCWTF